jgi:hypothetical protein
MATVTQLANHPHLGLKSKLMHCNGGGFGTVRAENSGALTQVVDNKPEVRLLARGPNHYLGRVPSIARPRTQSR